MNLRDDPHTCTAESNVCAHCGQVLPDRVVPQYGDKRTSRTGLAVTILLHLLLVGLYVFQPNRPKEKTSAAREGEVVYVAPLAAPTPVKPNTPSKPRKSAPAPQPQPRVERLPNTITLPDEKPAPVAKSEPKPDPAPPAPPARTEAEPSMDMGELLAKRRQQRGAPAEKPAEETEAQRGMRNALANVAGINRRARDAGDEDGEGRASLSFRDRTFHSMTIDMRVFNPNFGRNWLSTFTVEQNNAPDVETAVVDHMVQVLRRTMVKDFKYTLRNGKEIPMSTRLEDTEHLRDVLFRDMFPEYKRKPQ